MADKELKRKYGMIFMESSIEVFQKVLDIQLTKRTISIKSSSSPLFSTAITIGFVGKFIRGQVVYSLDLFFCEEISKRMMPNVLPVKRKKLLNSCIGELANIISGRATIELAGAEDIVDITPPSIIQGKNMKMYFLQVPTISLLMDSTIGSLEINVAFQNK